MIEAIFLIVWTAFFCVSAALLWIKIRRHSKIYLLMVFNFFYLTGVFLLFPGIDKLARLLYEYIG